jgi:hypothetical protein
VKTNASLYRNSGSGLVRWKTMVPERSSTTIPCSSDRAVHPEAPVIAPKWLVIGDETR